MSMPHIIGSEPSSPLYTRSTLSVSVAATENEIRECQDLRYAIFAGEMGARLSSLIPGTDIDSFDAHCNHLMVKDSNSGKVIATTRLLTNDGAATAGGFYSETEFDITSILALDGRIMEVGRTCIHRDYRYGAALAMLWHGIACMVVMKQIDYLIGCASISLEHGMLYANSLLHHLRNNHYSDTDMRVYPRNELPSIDDQQHVEVILPTLLKGYLKQGALICGEPCWDHDFNVADVFVLLDRERIAGRYVRHFIKRA